jgi:hypothetical protein
MRDRGDWPANGPIFGQIAALKIATAFMWKRPFDVGTNAENVNYRQ